MFYDTVCEKLYHYTCVLEIFYLTDGSGQAVLILYDRSLLAICCKLLNDKIAFPKILIPIRNLAFGKSPFTAHGQSYTPTEKWEF